jgi:hypothetical protein
MPFAAIPFIRVLSSKGISICNEETIVARRSIGFLIFIQRSFGNTSKAIFDGRIGAIQRELQQFPNPNEVVSLESNEQQQLLRISLRSITPEIVESLPNETARCAPKCERTVQAVSCRNLNTGGAWSQPTDWWASLFIGILVRVFCASLIFLCLGNGGFEAALCQSSEEGSSLEALWRSPVYSPIDWGDILGGGSATGESGVTAPREGFAPEAEAGGAEIPEGQAGGRGNKRRRGGVPAQILATPLNLEGDSGGASDENY